MHFFVNFEIPYGLYNWMCFEINPAKLHHGIISEGCTERFDHLVPNSNFLQAQFFYLNLLYIHVQEGQITT